MRHTARRAVSAGARAYLVERSSSLVISMLTRDRLGDGTAVGVNVEHALYGLAVFPVRGEVKCSLDPLDHQHLVLGLYLPDGVGVEALLVEGKLTRCQRAGKGAEQSAAGRHN
jgi:hypothetical protein